MSLFQFTTHKSSRRLVQAISTILIVALPFLNILRLDIPTLRFYFFTTILWVDEFYLLFLVIMLILWIIVIFAMLYGRVWCGWMCPQTVLDELYAWFSARARKWWKAPGPNVRTRAAFLRRAGHLTTVGFAAAAISLFIGFNLVAYFVDPYRMLAAIADLSLGPITTGCIIGIALLLWADIMFLRERFCTRACPYGMLQAVFTDSKTQIVRYITERHGECIECRACVRDCMMGIDIRTSPYQTECIHCGDCVDSCTAIMSRLKPAAPTLIRFSWGEQELPRTTWYQKLGLLDAKRWGVLGLTVVYGLVLFVLVAQRSPLALTASGDRSTLYHRSDDGRIYNEYALKISNRSIHDDVFSISCDAKGMLPVTGCGLKIPDNPLTLKSREVRTLRMAIYVNPADLHPGPNRLQLHAASESDPDVTASTEIVFFMPETQETGPSATAKEK